MHVVEALRPLWRNMEAREYAGSPQGLMEFADGFPDSGGFCMRKSLSVTEEILRRRSGSLDERFFRADN